MPATPPALDLKIDPVALAAFAADWQRLAGDWARLAECWRRCPIGRPVDFSTAALEFSTAEPLTTTVDSGNAPAVSLQGDAARN